MNVSLILVQTDGKQREVPLKKAVQVIGRQTDCQLRIPSSNISRHHCEITVGEGGQISLRDLGSSNGTFVNKQKVTQCTLKLGDLISLGGLVFAVKIDGKPAHLDSDDALQNGLVEITPANGAPESRPTAATVLTPSNKPSQTPGAKPQPAKSLVKGDPGDSSVADFDFLDDDDDIKGQPKL